MHVIDLIVKESSMHVSVVKLVLPIFLIKIKIFWWIDFSKQSA